MSAKLASARTEEQHFADRLATLEADLALNLARLETTRAPNGAKPSPSHQRALLNQRVADLLELRSSLIAERAKRRRLIDEMAQRKEAIDAALAVLRQKSQPPLVAAG
ncbi:MAG TPA: hypothetical protein DEA50_00700 [Parvularcula sp.]|nr:hypothetical protein [Parvularcula sp.]